MKLVYAGIGLAFILTMALFCCALGLRCLHMLQARSIARVRRIWWPVFAQAISPGGAGEVHRVPSRSVFHGIELLREWCRLRGAIQGAAADRMNDVADRLDLRRLARRTLTSKRIGRRLLAIQAVGLLGDQQSWSLVEELLMHRNCALSAAAAMALASIDAERAAPLVISRIGKTSRWPRTQIGRVLSEAGVAAVSAHLCNAIRTASVTEAIRLLQYADSASVSDLNRVTTEIVSSRDEPELLSAALKASRGPVAQESVRALTGHAVWHVRMHAATAIGHFGGQDSVKLLTPLLADREWWVRYRAAQAIIQLPFIGPNALRRLAREQQDRFARDIMNQALAERGLA